MTLRTTLIDRRRPTFRVLVALVAAGALVGVLAVITLEGPAVAQDRPAGRGGSAAPTGGDDEASDDSTAANAEAEERAEGGDKVKVFRFSGFDISGRLKSPQLLYFLNRLRAEFDRPRLPHRSFMPELERSTKSKAL